MLLAGLKQAIIRRDPSQKFFRSLGDPARILELGCGYGRNCLVLKALYPHAEILGVDLLDGSRVQAVDRYDKLDLDTEPLPYPEDSVDAVIFIHVIEHLRNPMNVAAEIKRVLRPGGSIYIEAPNWTSMLVPSFGFKREQSNPFNFFDDTTHQKPWTKQGLYSFLSNSCGVRVTSVGTVRNWVKLPIDLLRMPWGVLTGNRECVIAAFWNIYGWSICAIGKNDRIAGD